MSLWSHWNLHCFFVDVENWQCNHRWQNQRRYWGEWTFLWKEMNDKREQKRKWNLKHIIAQTMTMWQQFFVQLLLFSYLFLTS